MNSIESIERKKVIYDVIVTHVSSPNALTPVQKQFIHKVVRDNMHVEYEGDPVALRKKGFTVFTAERPHDADTILSPVLIDTSVFSEDLFSCVGILATALSRKSGKRMVCFFHIPRYRFFRKNDTDVLRDASNILSSLGSESVEESVRVVIFASSVHNSNFSREMFDEAVEKMVVNGLGQVAIAYMRENETSQLGQNVYFDTDSNEALVVQHNPHVRTMEE